MKSSLTSLLLLFLLTTCSKKESKEQQPLNCTHFELKTADISDTEAYAICNAFLRETGNTAFILTQQKDGLDSSSIQNILNFAFRGTPVDSALAKAYADTNLRTQYWSNTFETSVQLIAQEELQCLFQNESRGWKDYYNHHPEGYWTLNKPAVIGDRALFEYSYHCGWLCAEGAYILMKKVNDQWTLDQKLNPWAS